MADRAPVRLRRSLPTSEELRLRFAHATEIEVELEDLRDDPLTEREERAAGLDRPLRLTPPDWFIDMLKRGASPEDVLGTLRDRIADIQDLRVAQSIINEVGRLPSGGRLLRSFVTQATLDRLQEDRPHG